MARQPKSVESPNAPPEPARAAGARAAPWVVAVVTLITFARVVGQPFTDVDDALTIYANPRLSPQDHPPRWDGEGIGYYWTHSELSLYVPVTYTVWGALAAASWVPTPDDAGARVDPRFFHAASLLVHVAAAVFVYALLARLLRRPRQAGGAARGHPWAAAAGALLFGLHPLQVETVAWASGLKDLLAGAFGLAAVALYLRATADAEDDGRPRFRWPSYLLATACLVLAALSKPSAVVVPGLAGVIELIWLRRPVRGVVMRLAPWVLLMAPVVVVGKVAQPGAVVAPTPVVQRPVVAGASLAFYAGKLVLPVDLAFDYGWKPPVILARPTTWVLAGAAGAVLVGLAVAVLRWRDATGPRAWLAGTLWMTAALLPVLGLVPFHYQQVSTVADHYAYVALVGPALVLAWLIARRDWAPRPRLIIAPTLVVLFIALAARSVHQFGYWEGTEVFARRVLAVTPRSALGHSVLGRHLMLKPGRQADAEASMRAAIRYEPLFLNARTLLVTLLATQGRVDEAVREIHDLRAVNAQLPESDRKDFDDIFLQTGQVTLETGRPARAVRYFEEALKLRPGDPRATEGLRKAREAIATPRSK